MGVINTGRAERSSDSSISLPLQDAHSNKCVNAQMACEGQFIKTIHDTRVSVPQNRALGLQHPIEEVLQT